MLAWVLRFGLFAIGAPTGMGLMLIILSCIVYGMAFDFFNISGSLFVETTTDSKIRSSAQGLFMMMTNGFGAVLGSLTAGWLIEKFFTNRYTSVDGLAQHLETTVDNGLFAKFLDKNGVQVLADGALSQPIMLRDWPHIWLTFAAYALVIAILFAVLFKHKHNPEDVQNVSH